MTLFTALPELSTLPRPKAFPDPFSNTPHPIAIATAQHLQQRLSEGLLSKLEGKMFGVLVVENSLGKLGYLSACSGVKLADGHQSEFVPPILSVETRSTIYNDAKEHEKELADQLETVENNRDFHRLKQQKAILVHDSESALAVLINRHTQRKELRKQRRQQLNADSASSAESLQQLAAESITDKYKLKEQQTYWQQKIETCNYALAKFETQVSTIRAQRDSIEENLSKQLFDATVLTNFKAEKSSISKLFQYQLPLQGTGDCSSPKLLHYAQLNGFLPIALAEFWWGKSPEAEVRQHCRCYPSCKGRCAPLLPFMLNGLKREAATILGSNIPDDALSTVYEDDYLIVLNKPAGLLSIPGKIVQDSVLTRLREQHPDASGPLLVHRLDLSTSGLLLAAKSADVHKALQQQFIKRQVAKRYVALLEGEIENASGIIDLPLRVDFDDRPRQVVCDVFGKPSQTRWEALEHSNGHTRVHFYPLTGRTHQLRMHAAHTKGLNAPIVGDELYGMAGERLMLHAEYLRFTHPISSAEVTLDSPAPF